MLRAIRFRDKLGRHEICLGTVVSCNDCTITEALSRDLDFIWLDAEHGAMPLDSLQAHILATCGTNAAPIVRVAWNDPVLIKPVLDMGAEGIIVPMVRTVEDAQRAVAACKYPPEGVRGFGPRRPSAYGRLGGPEFCQRMNDSVLVILQIEHIDAVNAIENMVAVPGVSSVVLGPNDLSGSMGLLGQPRHPDVLAAIGKVIDACRKAGMPVGMGIGNDPAVINEWIAKGVEWVAMGNEYSLLITALDQVSRQVREFVQHSRQPQAGSGG
jgi:2-dehydro-3-deoxyglucarate aldolase/4-hydroxy-2-oxoheptanedioate aldolase